MEKLDLEVHLFLGKGEKAVIPHVKINNVGYKEVAQMILILEEVEKELKDRYPETVLFKNLYKTQCDEVQEKYL